jgi:5-methylcytosine-specific restriction endonuclease McrA
MQGNSSTFYSSQAWRDARAECRRRAGNRCEWCGDPCRANGRVDHRIQIADRPELALVQSNLRLLCAACDNRRHAPERGGGRALVRGADAQGLPTSPDHHWNRPSATGGGRGGTLANSGDRARSVPRS